MKKLFWCTITLTLMILLASCANADDATSTPLPAAADTAEPAPEATPTIPSPVDEPDEPSGYPPPDENGGYPAPDDSSGYPALPAPLPTADPYPGGVVWIIRPVGRQCEEGREFEDLATAVASLEENGISVLEAEETELLVCQSCDCPTSLHYRVQIDPADLVQATRLGWLRELN